MLFFLILSRYKRPFIVYCFCGNSYLLVPKDHSSSFYAIILHLSSHGFFELAILNSPFDAEIGNPLPCRSTRNSSYTNTSSSFLGLTFVFPVGVDFVVLFYHRSEACIQLLPSRA